MPTPAKRGVCSSSWKRRYLFGGRHRHRIAHQGRRRGKIAKDAVVMLNITGGGELHFKEDKTLWYLKPDHVFPIDPDPEEVIAKTEALFA